jgi:hypothetical protein
LFHFSVHSSASGTVRAWPSRNATLTPRLVAEHPEGVNRFDVVRLAPQHGAACSLGFGQPAGPVRMQRRVECVGRRHGEGAWRSYPPKTFHRDAASEV